MSITWSSLRAIPSCALAILLAGLTVQPAFSAGVWVGDVDGDWNNAANWDTDPALPTGDLTVNNTAGPGVFPVISANSLITPEDIFIGDTATGRLDHTAGTLVQTTLTGDLNNWVVVGRDSGNGTYNVADTAVAGGTYTGFGQGSGSLDAGKLWIGGSPKGADFYSTGTGVVNVNTTGVINLSGQGPFNNDQQAALQLGRSAASVGTLNIDSGTVHVRNSEGWIAKDGTGYLNISGGILNVDRWVAIARNGASHAEVVMTGGEFHGNLMDDGAFIVGDGDDTTATFQMSGDSLVHSRREMWIGQNGEATWTQDGGTVHSEGWFAIGRDRGTGVYNLNGGTVNTVDRFGQAAVVGAFNNGNGTLNISGGTFNTLPNQPDRPNGTDLWVAENGTGKVSVSGTGVLNVSGDLSIARGGNGRGTLEVIGSTATIDVDDNFFSDQAGPTGTLSFIADAMGISTIAVGGDVNMGGANDTLLVDLSSYFGMVDLLLVDGTTSQGEFSNFAQGTLVATSGSLIDYSIDYGVAGDVWLRANTIPEPASYLILGGLGLAIVAMRRRLG